MPQFPAVIELSQLDGSNGFAIGGAPNNTNVGFRVASAGDVNGDGFADVIFTGSFKAPYVVFGHGGQFDAAFDLGTLDGQNGFKVISIKDGEALGMSVSGVGDINGDGFDDAMIGTGYGFDGGYSTLAYVVYGTSSGFDGVINAADLDGSNGFVVKSTQSGFVSGDVVAAAGDVNGDGFDDFAIGSNEDDVGGAVSPTYVIFGKSSNFTANFDVVTLDGNNGFRFNAGDHAHVYSHISSGDVNGDGSADVMVGTLFSNVSPGSAYVIYGKADGFAASIDAADLDGTNGFAIVGVNNYDYAGVAGSIAGDINGDGLSDMVIGAWGVDANGSNAGATYVVFGNASGFGASLALATIDGTNGFKILGALAGDGAGRSVDLAGDFNGDGFSDLLVSASGVDTHGSSSGAAYVVFGASGGFAASIDLADLDGDNGITINGAAIGDAAGRSARSAGDVNGDGFDDLIIGAPYVGANNNGASYVVFGIAPEEAVHRTGTVASQTLAGGAFNDHLKGVRGDDRLYGNGGHDVLNGGAGKDSLKGGAGSDLLIGGGSKDVFVFEDAAASTGIAYDIAKAANFSHGDRFDFSFAVTGVDAGVAGSLSAGSFDGDLASALNGAHMAQHHAVLFTASGGDLSGKVFLVVDANNVAGYQAGEDVVINLLKAKHLDALDTADFI